MTTLSRKAYFAIYFFIFTLITPMASSFADNIEAQINALAQGGFSDRAKVINALAETGDTRVAPALDALANGLLYVQKLGGKG